MNVADPTLDEWRELYAAAEEFRNLQPWIWMSDADLFGVDRRDVGSYGAFLSRGGQYICCQEKAMRRGRAEASDYDLS